MRGLMEIGITEEHTGRHQTFRELNGNVFPNSYLFTGVIPLMWPGQNN